MSNPASCCGTLAVDARGHWTMQWSLNWNGVERRWRLDGVTFDVALAAGIDDAVGILSARR